MFQGNDRAEAVAVPFFYGFTEALLLLVYCLVTWKAGWTKAPKDVSFWNMLFTSYEILSDEGEAEHSSGDGDDFYMIDYKDAEKATELTAS